MQHDASQFVGHEMVQLAHLLGRAMERALTELELTATSFSALFHLAEDPDISAAELARRILVSPQAIGPVLDRLEDLGLVTRHRPPVRGARSSTMLTERGCRRLDHAIGAVAELDQHLLAPLTPARRRAFAADLAALSEHARQPWAPRSRAQPGGSTSSTAPSPRPRRARS